MINDFANHWIPSPGYKYLSNGTIWTDSIFLGRTDRIERWHDTNDEPPAPEDAYAKGDKVRYPDESGDVWISDVDQNVWEPGVYGWSLEV